MKKLLRVSLWIAGIVTILLLIGAFLPGTVTVSRSSTIKAPASVVYAVLNDLKTYNSWMPWNQLDTAMEQEFSPVTSGKGAYYTWKSTHKSVGNGKLSITESIPDKQVMTSLEFGGFDQASIAGWDLSEGNGQTNITWTMNSDLSHNPINRWFGLFFDRMIGPDFEKGLAALKSNIESGHLKTQQPTMTLERVSRPAMLVLTIMDTAQTMADIGPKLQKAYGELGDLVKSSGLHMQDAPMSWYYSEKEPFILEPAIAVDKMPAKTSGRIRMRKLPATDAIVVHYFGPYESSSLAYARISEYLKANNLGANGAPMDIYVDDPTTKKSMFEVRTDIVQPIH